MVMKPQSALGVVACAMFLYHGEGATTGTPGQVEVRPATGNTWVCSQEAQVVWPVNNALPADTPVSLLLMGPSKDDVQVLCAETFRQGNQDAKVMLDCTALAIETSDSEAYMVAIAVGSEDNVEGMSAPFAINNVAISSPAPGAALPLGRPFTLSWVAAPEHEGSTAKVELFGKPQEGQELFLETLAEDVPNTGSVELTLPTKSSAYPSVAIRLTVGDHAVAWADYPLAGPKAALVQMPEVQTQTFALAGSIVYRIVKFFLNGIFSGIFGLLGKIISGPTVPTTYTYYSTTK